MSFIHSRKIADLCACLFLSSTSKFPSEDKFNMRASFRDQISIRALPAEKLVVICKLKILDKPI